MRTTLNLDDNIIKEVIGFTNSRNRSEAIRIALEEYVLQKRIDRFLSRCGSVEFEYDLEAQRKTELKAEIERNRLLEDIGS